MKALFPTFLLFCIFSLDLSSQALRIDQRHMDLNLSLNPPKGKVEAKLEILFRLRLAGRDSIVLNAVNIEIEKLELDGTQTPFVNTGKEVRFASPMPFDSTIDHRLNIQYSCIPRKGIYFRGWDGRGGRSQIWTQGQGIDHRHWIPHQDDQRDKLTHSIHIGFPDNYKVISNGELIEERLRRDSVYWNFETKKECSSYLLALAIGEYKTQEEKTVARAKYPSVDIHNYYYPDQAHAIEANYGSTQELFTWMEEAIAYPYQWSGTFDQVPVSNFKHGAMENTGAVIIGDIFLQDSLSLFLDRTYLEIQAHELAHHWFGNLVTANNTASHWWHEGFASYWQWEAKRKFEDLWMYRRARQMAFERINMVQESIGAFSIEEDKAGSVGFYDKGGWVVSMLYDWLDSSDASGLLSGFMQERAYGLMNGSELFDYLEKQNVAYAQDFYADWVESGEMPTFHLEKGKKEFILSSKSISPCKVEFAALLKDGSFWKWSGKKKAKEMEIPFPEDAILVIPDPRSRLLVKWKWDDVVLLGDNEFWLLPDALRARYLRLSTPKSKTIENWLDKAPKGVEASETLWILADMAEADDKWIGSLLDLALDGRKELLDGVLTSLDLPNETSNATIEAIWSNSTYKSREAVINWMFSTNDQGLKESCEVVLQMKAPSIQSHAVRAAVYLHLMGESSGTQALISFAGPDQEFVTRGMALEAMTNRKSPIWDERIFVDALKDYFDPNGRISVPCREYISKWLNQNGADDVQEDILSIASTWTNHQRSVFEKKSGHSL